MVIFWGLIGFLGLVIGLGLCALEFIVTYGREAVEAWMGYEVPLMIFVGGLAAIFLAFVIHSIENQEKQERQQKNSLDWALNLLKKGDTKGVIYWHKKEKDPSDTDPIQIVVKIAEAMQNDSLKSIKELSMSQLAIYDSIGPSLDEAYINYARSLFIKKNYSSAQKWFQLVYERKKEESCLYLGLCCLQLHDYSKASYFLTESLANKQTFTVLYNLLLIHTYLKQYKNALKDLKELRKVFPEELKHKKKVLLEIPFEHLMEEQ